MRLACVFLLLSAQYAAGADAVPSHVRMRNVNFRLDPSLALEIAHLEGKLLPAQETGVTAIFDDAASFILEIDSAEVAITPAGLTHMLNTYVFAGKESPIKNLTVTIEGGKIKQKGTLKKGVDIPFEIVGRLEATPEGKIRIHPTGVKAAKIPVKGLMDLFGVDVAELISTKHARGVEVSKDDIILDPEQMLPPPRIKGKVTSVRIERNRIVEVFGTPPKQRPAASEGNYMAYRGGTLRFGKLTMQDADLTLIDRDPRDPFDFFLAKYRAQLVAGYSKNTPTGGLRTYVPDYGDVRRSSAARSSAVVSARNVPAPVSTEARYLSLAGLR